MFSWLKNYHIWWQNVHKRAHNHPMHLSYHIFIGIQLILKSVVFLCNSYAYTPAMSTWESWGFPVTWTAQAKKNEEMCQELWLDFI